MDERTHFRTCPLCEATCGLAITIRGREVLAIRGDDDDVLSHGFICPKGPALAALDNDPDRLRRPMIRRGDTWQDVSWDDAFGEIDRHLPHGRQLGARRQRARGPACEHLVDQLAIDRNPAAGIQPEAELTCFIHLE